MFKLFQILFLSVALNILATPARSCSCSGPFLFCETIKFYQSTSKRVRLVIKGIKVSEIAHGMKIRIIDTIAGVPANDTVMVWGDDGFNCRWYVSQFKTSDTMIFSLPYTDMTGGGASLEKPTDYMISSCGTFYMYCKNDTVTGSGLPSPGQPYSVFKNSIAGCFTGIHESDFSSSISIFPNASSGKFELDIQGFHSARISIFNSLGQKVWQDSSNNLPMPIDLSDHALGVYFIKVESKDKILGMKKVIIQ